MQKFTDCPFDAYYDAPKKSYLVLDADNNWIEQAEQQLIRRLKAAGVSKLPDSQGLRPIDRMLIAIQDHYSVCYTGPLAGHARGFDIVNGSKILVTSEARTIAPTKGSWSTLEAFFKGLFVHEPYDQLPTYYSWLKVADESFTTNTRRPGQAMIVAGPRGCGKSLDQKINTEVFGGRSGKPFEYMMGLTSFNRELFGAEHLMIEDEIASQDLRVRRNFGAFIKKLVANEVIACYGKHREAISLSPIWRLSITLNDEPENLMILPPLDESLADKVILFRAYHKPMPMPTNTLDEQRAFWIQLMSELPHFLYFLRREWEIPADIKCERYGVKHYHHPEIVKAIYEISPHAKLLNLIDIGILGPDKPHWTGTSERLEKELLDCTTTAYAAKKLLSFPGSCGTYLGLLQKFMSHRVQFEGRSKNLRIWKLVRDAEHEEASIISSLNNSATLPPFTDV